MTGTINLIKNILRFPAIWIGGFYLFWLLSIPIDESYTDGIKLLILYSIITILETQLGTNKTFSIVFFIILLPFTLIFSILALDLWASTTGWLDRELIYIPLIILFSSYITYNLFKNSSIKNKTLRILAFIATFPILVINIAYPVSLLPEISDQKEFGNSKYYVVWGIDFNYQSHMSFYKCKKWSIRCDRYRTYEQMYIDKILIDIEKNEVSAIDSNFDLGLAFTYGDNSRSYDAFPVQLGDHVYQPSTDHHYGNCETSDCDIYTSTVYECDLDYTSCDPLPVQYSATSDTWIYLTANEDTDEINAYNFYDVPIFTYGEHPVCYVDGCVILDQ